MIKLLHYTTDRFLVILISPSAGGKSSIARKLLADSEKYSYSVSYTTRPVRKDEKNGIHYHFVDKSTFSRLASTGEFLEQAQVHGHQYATSRQVVCEALQKGRHVVLDIDVQGALQIMSQDIDAVTIFILPPSMQILRERLQDRGSDDQDVIRIRMKTAQRELELIEKFQYLVINDDLEQAVLDVKKIISAEEMKISRFKNIKDNFLEV
ncbi:MAG: guanylate kinase [Candidatus Cloacimonetes bacterium]|nr:guanylate kinase [Candidatus Cloacimonadota bacterium]